MHSRRAAEDENSESGPLSLQPEDSSPDVAEDHLAKNLNHHLPAPANDRNVQNAARPNTNAWNKPTKIFAGLFLMSFIINGYLLYESGILKGNLTRINIERKEDHKNHQLELAKVASECEHNASNKSSEHEIAMKQLNSNWEKELMKERYESKLNQQESGFQCEKKFISCANEIQNLQIQVEQNRTFHLQEQDNQRKECYENLQKCQWQCQEQINAWISESDSVSRKAAENMSRIEEDLNKCQNRDLSENFKAFAGSLITFARTLGGRLIPRLSYGG